MSDNKQLANRDEPKAVVPIVEGRFAPTDIAGMYRLAQLLLMSGMCPNTWQKPEQVVIALEAASRVGLPVMCAPTHIYIVNNRPTLFGDAPLAVIRSKGKLEDFEETIDGDGDKRTATCKMKRAGQASPIIRTFSVADAKRAHLWGKSGPWTNNPDRMLAFRARGFCCRDGFGDDLLGLGIYEEEVDRQTSERAVRGVAATAAVASLDVQDSPTLDVIDAVPEREPDGVPLGDRVGDGDAVTVRVCVIPVMSPPPSAACRAVRAGDRRAGRPPDRPPARVPRRPRSSFLR